MSGWNDQFRNPTIIPEKVLRMMPVEERRRLGKAGLTAGERQEKIEAKRETELQERIAAMLRIRQIEFLTPRWDRATTIKTGWPDFTFAVGGRACSIEVKMPGQDPRPEQLACMARLMRDGWFVRVVRSEAEFLQALAEAEKVRNDGNTN